MPIVVVGIGRAVGWREGAVRSAMDRCCREYRFGRGCSSMCSHRPIWCRSSRPLACRFEESGESAAGLARVGRPLGLPTPNVMRVIELVSRSVGLGSQGTRRKVLGRAPRPHQGFRSVGRSGIGPLVSHVLHHGSRACLPLFQRDRRKCGQRLFVSAIELRKNGVNTAPVGARTHNHRHS